jgi:S-(hydroxymethyl)glutathione dehydrogenase/alcohol dehydrogenase
VPNLPVALTEDGVEVVQSTNIGGHAEMMITLEEWCAPFVSDLPAHELSLLSCVAGTGLGTTMTLAPITPGANVAIFGLGPIGLSAVQGAKMLGATQIIGIEPIRARRELALQFGATTVLDPNEFVAEPTASSAPFFADPLVTRIRELCAGNSESFFSGQPPVSGQSSGADFVIEAVGGDRFVPRVEAGPDPTGILPLHQAWEVCAPGSHLVTTSIGHNQNIEFSGTQWALFGRTHHPSQFGGTHLKRDIPRYVRLIEQGHFDAASLATATFPLEQTNLAFEAAMYRTTVNAILVME